MGSHFPNITPSRARGLNGVQTQVFLVSPCLKLSISLFFCGNFGSQARNKWGTFLSGSSNTQFSLSDKGRPLATKLELLEYF